MKKIFFGNESIGILSTISIPTLERKITSCLCHFSMYSSLTSSVQNRLQKWLMRTSSSNDFLERGNTFLQPEKPWITEVSNIFICIFFPEDFRGSISEIC